MSDTVQYPKDLWDKDPSIRERMFDFIERDFSGFPEKAERLTLEIKLNEGEGSYDELGEYLEKAKQTWLRWWKLTREEEGRQDTGEVMALEKQLQQILQTLQERVRTSEPVRSPLRSGPAQQYPMEQHEEWMGLPRELREVNQFYGRQSFSHILGMLNVLRDRVGISLELGELEMKARKLWAEWREMYRGAPSEMVEQAKIHEIERALNDIERVVWKHYQAAKPRSK